VMDTLESKWAGYYYDLENAAQEGGLEGWRIAANLVMPRMKMMAAKDFYWKKTETKSWQATTCPLAEGMCKHGEFLRMAPGGIPRADLPPHGVPDSRRIRRTGNCPVTRKSW